MIKARSLEVTLPTINFIYDVYMSLLKQDYQEGTGIRECYEVYKNTTMYENIIRARFLMSQLPIV